MYSNLEVKYLKHRKGFVIFHNKKELTLPMKKYEAEDMKDRLSKMRRFS